MTGVRVVRVRVTGVRVRVVRVRVTGVRVTGVRVKGVRFTCRSPIRFCTEAWSPPIRENIDPKMIALPILEPRRARFVALSRVDCRNDRPKKSGSCRRQLGGGLGLT